MEQIQESIPIVLIDMAGFSTRNRDTKTDHLKRLQQGIRESIQPMIGFADPEQVIRRHGTGDGYYLFLNGYPIPVALRFALNLETFLYADKKQHSREEPLRLRLGLTLGEVGLVGDQYLGDALTQAQRLVDHDWIRELLKERPDDPLALVASATFWNQWNHHPKKSHPNLAFPENRPWIEEQLIVKHGDAIPCRIQVEEDIFSRIKRKIPPSVFQPQLQDLTPWLQSLRDRTQYIKISGIGSGGGRGKLANLYPIEQLFTTLKTRESQPRDSTTGPEAVLDRIREVNLADLLPRHRHLFIEGQPGTGKTTFLHLAAATLAKDLLEVVCPEGGTWRKRYLGMDDPEPYTPLFLKLSELATLLTDRKSGTRADDCDRLLDLLQTTPDASEDPAWRDHWQQLLRNGRALLLLDGLDEVADDAVRERFFSIVQSAKNRWNNCRIIVTSRPFGAERLAEIGFHRAVIEPFDAEATQKFIGRWSAAIHATGQQPEGEARQHAQKLEAAILNSPAIRLLAANPVMLTCLCVIHWNEGELPEGRARVYKAVIRWLLGSREHLRKERHYTDRYALEAFAAIALAMMGREEDGKKAICDLEEAAKVAWPLFRRHFPTPLPDLRQVRDWVRFEALHSGILEEPSRTRIRFWHLTFQEYLAAQELAWKSDEGWWQVIEKQLLNAQWRETVNLLPGVLFDEGGKRRVDDLLSQVLNKYSGTTLVDAARQAGILGRILEPMKAYQYQPDPEIRGQYLDVLKRATAIFTVAGARKVPVSERLSAAEALGQGGDSRLAEDQWQNNMIPVPETDICLGKYLVTVMEYQRFIEDRGYDTPDFWQEERAWTFRQAEGWSEPSEWLAQLNHPNRPVVGVSWYEAWAYCHWLHKKRGIPFHLPEEKDWERAATHRQGDYPWGREQPTPELANYDAGKIDAPSPVGIYPADNGPHGHCDLAGNVWEWSASPWTEGGIGDERVKKYGPPKVVRGGSWFDPASGLRVGLRYVSLAGGRGGVLGFRLAAPASLGS
ncbi:MAG: SUMF1/EgtB/PvdO family nonheme iron enzyme [Magnetococcales bacterium]|nr:SUMF1/EgtB/PvdO family nonheme iron enzyme [Magnetococcales bacterium]